MRVGFCVRSVIWFLKKYISFSFSQSLKNFLLKICKKIDDYEKSKTKQNDSKNLLFLSFRDDGIYLNDTKIIDKKAKLQIAVYSVLVEHYKNEISCGSSYLPISKICSDLRKMGIDSCNLESQIHTSIHRIRNSVHKITKSKDIIESSKWRGYRFHDRVFIERNRQV